MGFAGEIYGWELRVGNMVSGMGRVYPREEGGGRWNSGGVAGKQGKGKGRDCGYNGKQEYVESIIVNKVTCI